MISRTHCLIGLAVTALLTSCTDGSGLAENKKNAESWGIAARPENTECVALADDSGSVQSFSGLQFDGAITGIYQAPGDNDHWFVTTQKGVLARFDNTENVASHVVISGVPQVYVSIEAGLLSMAFHPQFSSNGYIYLSYLTDSTAAGLQSHITRYTLAGTALTLPQEILTIERTHDTHNGGQIAFGPDGYLYASFGDGDDSGNSVDNGQNSQTLLSKLLRIDVDSGTPYAVPPDNPFVADSSYLPQIYALGFRNPWRWSFDRHTGEIWMGEVGQSAWEEVNRIEAGGNYGWPIMEGSHCYDALTCDSASLATPIWEYNHSEGCSITGGFVYRGTAIPELNGYYLYGDYCGRDVMGFAIDNPAVTNHRITALPSWNISTFGEGNDGEIMIGTNEGLLYRLTGRDTTTSPIPQTLSDHPCFANTATHRPGPGVIPYSVNNALWSDGAEKRRFIALPDNTSIDVDATGDLLFPVGSVLIKQFEHNGKPVETRFLMHHASGWSGYSYEWNNDGSDATLSTTAHAKIIDDEYTHLFPSTSQCFQCHKIAGNFALGLELTQLDRTHDYEDSGISSNQLDTWQHMGLFGAAGLAYTSNPLPALNDLTATTEQRARAYLHSNCSGCHRLNGFPGHFDLRYSLSLADTGICNTQPKAGDLGITGAKLLVPGNAALSLIYQRMNRRGEYQMPPLASAVVDDAAVAVVGEWIDGLSGCP